jgi:hypothetical protein
MAKANKVQPTPVAEVVAVEEPIKVTGTEFQTEAEFKAAIKGLTPEQAQLALEDRGKGPSPGIGGRVGGLCVECRRYVKKGTVIHDSCRAEGEDEAEAEEAAPVAKKAKKAKAATQPTA